MQLLHGALPVKEKEGVTRLSQHGDLLRQCRKSRPHRSQYASGLDFLCSSHLTVLGKPGHLEFV